MTAHAVDCMVQERELSKKQRRYRRAAAATVARKNTVGEGKQDKYMGHGDALQAGQLHCDSQSCLLYGCHLTRYHITHYAPS
jgi:hypothetical protein